MPSTLGYYENEYSTRNAGGFKKPPEGAKKIAGVERCETPGKIQRGKEPWKGERMINFLSPFQGFHNLLNEPGVPLRFTSGYSLLALPGLY